MNGFLGRIAAKELGTAPALTPRLPSRFELEAPSSPAAFDAFATSEEQTAVSQPPARMEHDEEETSPRSAHAMDTPRAHADAPKKDIAAREVPVLAATQRSAREDMQRPSVPTAREAIGERTEMTTQRPRRIADEDVPAPLRIVPSLVRLVERVGEDADSTDRAEPVVPHSEDVRAGAMQPPFALREPTSRAATQSARDAEPAPAAETVVNVSIGRIEVRATPSAKTPASSRRDTSALPMRLEEYLRGRSDRSAS